MAYVLIHTLLHFAQSILYKTTYIFCLIVLQTLIYVIKPTWLAFKICWRRVTQNFFMDNFNLVLKETYLPSILRSFVNDQRTKTFLMQTFFYRHFIAQVIAINFVVRCVLFLQKQPLEVFSKKSCS